MYTTLGYEEMRRLHEERVARSLRKYGDRRLRDEAALVVPGREPEPCQVIELPLPQHPEHRIGA